ncbi:hypothetical protein [Shimia ponticola]|uniref:hypothetical protein n=1 Tax=Shimia ponticola TaxID=2582893 RepID=UPI0011BE2AAC|nr:hypothetical protein [Shimia ponticola]
MSITDKIRKPCWRISADIDDQEQGLLQRPLPLASMLDAVAVDRVEAIRRATTKNGQSYS